MTLANTTVGQKFHHGIKTYAEADSEAARFALHKIEKRIEGAVANAQATLERIFTDVPQDAMVRSKAMNFQVDPDAETPDLVLDAGDAAWHLHQNARSQVFQRGFTRLGGYANAVIEHGNADERTQLVHMLNTHYNTRDARYLTRSLTRDDGALEMRGFLSDHYKVIDSRPTAETFVKQCGSLGLVPLEGTVTDTRAYMKFLLPKVYEPVENEVMAFGLTYQNSDFGNGTLLIRSFMYRCWCTNQAMMDDMLREVHLGAKLPEGVVFSDETKRLNAETSCSAMRDVIQGALSEDAVASLCYKIEKAATAKMSWAQLNDKLKEFNKGERDAVKTAFEGPDVEMLPAGGATKWRASNAVSFIANSIQDADRRAAAQRVAGALVQ